MIQTLITPAEVYDIAYSSVAQYTPVEVITEVDILTAEQRYLVPVIGERLYAAISSGEYTSLVSDYIAPTLSLYVREVVNAPSAPASKDGMRRARAMMIYLSDYLDDNQDSYPEYVESENILKRCRIYGADIQIR